MRIAVLQERAAGESRVAATPETVRKFVALGASLYGGLAARALRFGGRRDGQAGRDRGSRLCGTLGIGKMTPYEFSLDEKERLLSIARQAAARLLPAG